MSSSLALPASSPVSPLQPNVTAAMQSLQSAKNKTAVHTAANKFESMFMQEMMSHMFEGVQTDGQFGGGHGEEMYKSLMVEQYGKKIADSGQTGITPLLEKQMLRMQEERINPNQPVNMNATGGTHDTTPS
jgi:Rod binding domain-containing protein